MASLDNLLVGQSGPMREIKRLIELAAPSTTTLLVQGETGTGKELVAQAVHQLSERTGQLVSVNCSAIPSELLESELFGHEKGPLPAQINYALAGLSWQMAARYFWMKSGICHFPLQANYCVRLKAAQSKGSAGQKKYKLISASSAQPTRILKLILKLENSEQTFFIE